MMNLGETGPLELGQILVLAAASCVFLITAIKGRGAGAPALAAFSLMLGVAALREYDTEMATGWEAYLASHAARWHLVALLFVPLILVSIRDRRTSLGTHARAVLILLPFFVAGIGLVWLAAAIEEWGGTLRTTPDQKTYLLLVEELLELAAYGLTLGASLWHVVRTRHAVSSMWSPLITYLPTRTRKPWHRFGRA